MMKNYQKNTKLFGIRSEAKKNIKLDALPVYDDRYIKTKVRTYGNKLYTNFRGLNVPKNDLECESFTVFSIDFLPVYENKYYLQVYLDTCVYKTVNKQKTDYLHENVFEDLILQMLYYDRIHISEGINLAKSNSRKVCMICNC